MCLLNCNWGDCGPALASPEPESAAAGMTIDSGIRRVYCGFGLMNRTYTDSPRMWPDRQKQREERRGEEGTEEETASDDGKEAAGDAQYTHAPCDQ